MPQMNLALYRKYRPQSFDELAGQPAIERTLRETMKQGRFVHAYLFAGPRGTGKTSTARLLARAIQCLNRDAEGAPCGSCDVCQAQERNELIDLVEIDAASNRGVDEIRDLREKIRFSPTLAKSKVYIIDEVHMLTKEAFNALLKSLEEPPSHVYFILATTELHKIPETILSRCQRYDFKRLPKRAIVDRLAHIAKAEGFPYEMGALELLAHHADGGMRDAISMLEQFASEGLREDLIRERLGVNHHHSCDELYVALGTADTQAGINLIEKLHNEGVHLQQFTTDFLSLLRGKLHEAVAANKKGVLPKLLDWIELFDDAWVKLKQASIVQLPLEIAVIRATHSPQTEAPQQAKRQEGLVHMDAIQSQLSKVLEAIRNPSFRQSFGTARLKKREGNVLTFAFNSRFHYDKVHSAEALVDIEQAFKSLLNEPVKVMMEVETTQLMPETAPVDTLDWETAEEPL